MKLIDFGEFLKELSQHNGHTVVTITKSDGTILENAELAFQANPDMYHLKIWWNGGLRTIWSDQMVRCVTSNLVHGSLKWDRDENCDDAHHSHREQVAA